MTENPALLVALFLPIGFVAVWILSTMLIGLLSGWYRLQRQYLRPDEPALLTLRYQSGWLGIARMGNILTLRSHRTGLSVGIVRALGPFQRPFLVPWEEISSQEARMLFARMIELRFGRPRIGQLTISESAWRQLAAAANR